MFDVDFVIFFVKQKTAYESRISDWSSDVCSSDLNRWSGDLSGMTDEDIEDEAKWEGDPGALVKALVAVKYLDGATEGARALHDWVEHNPYAASKGADRKSVV